MKTVSSKVKSSGFTLIGWFIVLALLAGERQAISQDARFFRITGPAATKIMEFRSDGSLVWSNALAGTNYTIQAANSVASESNWVDYIRLPANQNICTNKVVSFNPPDGMTFIPAGIFTMGDTFNDGIAGGYHDELPLHEVSVSALYMDQHDVTKALWESIYQWATNHGYIFDSRGEGKAADHPVVSVNWYDVVKWCNARSEKEGRTPAYYTDAAQTVVYRVGQIAMQSNLVKWNAGYRLPTEAEWEKAARGGARGQRFACGNTVSWSQANHYSEWSVGVPIWSYDICATNGYDPAYLDENYPPLYTNPVNVFEPNGYRLCDMVGNVWQWCWDFYGSYSGPFQIDPHGAATSQGSLYPDRVIRGGSWGASAFFCRSATRYSSYSNYSFADVGFRCVLPP